MKIRYLIGLPVVLGASLLAACAGNPVPDGPIYYVTDGVLRVLYGDANGQIACVNGTLKASHIMQTRCFTAEEVVEMHLRDKEALSRWSSRCPSPGLCKQ